MLVRLGPAPWANGDRENIPPKRVVQLEPKWPGEKAQSHSPPSRPVHACAGVVIRCTCALYNNTYALRNTSPPPLPIQHDAKRAHAVILRAADEGTSLEAADARLDPCASPSEGSSPGASRSPIGAAPHRQAYPRTCTLARRRPAWPHIGVYATAPLLSRSAAAQQRLHHARGSSCGSRLAFALSAHGRPQWVAEAFATR